MRTNSFTSSYSAKEKSFLVQSKDKFGRIFITHCSRKERDKLKREFNAVQKEVLISNVVRHTPKKIAAKKIAAKKNISNVIPETAYYVIENFSASLFSAEGELLNVLELGRFILMPRWYEKKLNLDDNQISYHKIIDVDVELCLLILLPKLSFRDKQVTFQFPYVVGTMISYLQAKSISKQINRYGFQKTIVNVCQIPKSTISGNPFATDMVIKRIANEHKRKESERSKIFRNKRIVLKSRRRKEKYTIKGHTSKVYYTNVSNDKIHNKVNGRIDRKILMDKEGAKK